MKVTSDMKTFDGSNVTVTQVIPDKPQTRIDVYTTNLGHKMTFLSIQLEPHLFRVWHESQRYGRVLVGFSPTKEFVKRLIATEAWRLREDDD
jgi:hypothetical protein